MTGLFSTESSGENQTRQSSTPKIFLCKICLSNYPVHKGLQLKKCECIFCEECLKHYLEHSISEGNVLEILCPDGGCSQQGDITQLEISKILDDSKFDQYERLRKRKEVAVDKSKTFCPIPGCEGVCDGIPGMAQQTYCQDCGFTFCFECKEPWHSGRTCKEYLKNSTDTTSGLRFIDILKEGGTNDIKECPICQVLIQRDAGCAQMMCGNCKHMFCWHCRKSLDSDILLRHYDKGPCRNKLGHSRATLFLHRTQVIAGFIFFGAMILVASPFLLIISPCFLVSKCLFRRSEPSSL
ncbi:probable E3 ubiquitin-protein ligase RNF144A-B [Actinia tenebrosa]|uniref:RBR-type E3 ubiquitin transferase n=1 Tax=Actinia tenebrosa TaxID=6105 RepID=A0A6P8IR85_ACTTE|nr:probable E3 ubiquitin-protein ligase RNF144A-B [Actinia tenebrosa]XP_031569636.1 probable E3 ubiquitin-protein ligase RNF144A-B [Actinia tenebrosa]XP_031569637.1 probable E3 ubiquitin-protein ligase RNF144A-B [Actinia tenebrosa]XP_031569638.1 probable E3 ubiquitin-protein ligase RNF144A-B [Actinia tenebrosa]